MARIGRYAVNVPVTVTIGRRRTWEWRGRPCASKVAVVHVLAVVFDLEQERVVAAHKVVARPIGVDELDGQFGEAAECRRVVFDGQERFDGVEVRDLVRNDEESSVECGREARERVAAVQAHHGVTVGCEVADPREADAAHPGVGGGKRGAVDGHRFVANLGCLGDDYDVLGVCVPFDDVERVAFLQLRGKGRADAGERGPVARHGALEARVGIRARVAEDRTDAVGQVQVFGLAEALFLVDRVVVVAGDVAHLGRARTVELGASLEERVKEHGRDTTEEVGA